MSTNPDIKRALGAVTCEPTEDSIKLYANDVDITNEIGGSDPGYTVEETKQTVIAEQTAQTISQGDFYNGMLSGDLSGVSDGTKCFVTYNGTEYEVDATEDAEHGLLVIGELSGQSPVFTNYPFVIAFVDAARQIVLIAQTESPTIKAEALIKTVVPSEIFKEAVKTSLNNPVFPHIVQVLCNSNEFVPRESFDDVLAILDRIEVPVQMQFLYDRFNGLLISLEEKRTQNLTSIQGHFVLNELREASATYSGVPTLYTMIWTSANGITIDTQALSIPSSGNGGM